jgi:hypothetical protein
MTMTIDDANIALAPAEMARGWRALPAFVADAEFRISGGDDTGKRSNAHKRALVRAVLNEGYVTNHAAVARECRVSPSLVSNVLEELKREWDCERADHRRYAEALRDAWERLPPSFRREFLDRIALPWLRGDRRP